MGPRERGVLPLQPDPGPAHVGRELLGQVERRRAVGNLTQQAVELGKEGRVGKGGAPCLLELLEGSDEHLGHEPPAVLAEPPALVGHLRRA